MSSYPVVAVAVASTAPRAVSRVESDVEDAECGFLSTPSIVMAVGRSIGLRDCSGFSDWILELALWTGMLRNAGLVLEKCLFRPRVEASPEDHGFLPPPLDSSHAVPSM